MPGRPWAGTLAPADSPEPGSSQRGPSQRGAEPVAGTGQPGLERIYAR